MTPLTTNADNSHSFYLPATPNIVPDIDNLLQPRQTLPPVHAIGEADWDITQLAPGFGHWRLTMYEPRGRYRQRADFVEGHNMQAEGDLVGDDQGILRHAFYTEALAGPDPTGLNGFHLRGADFKGKTVISIQEGTTPHLYIDSGAYEPSIAALAGYVAIGSHAQCLEPVTIAGGEVLLRGYLDGLEAITSLSPVVNAAVAAFAGTPVYGVVQTPVDGASIMAYSIVGTKAQLRVFNTDVALGAATYQNRALLPGPSGYIIGMIAFGHNPEIFIYIPTASGYGAGSGGGNQWLRAGPDVKRGRIIKTDLRGLVVSDFETNFLSHVVHATAMPNAMFLCNEKDHYYCTNGANLPVDTLSDRVADSNTQRICAGHVPLGHKCLYYINEVHYDNTPTVRYVMEFDSLTRTVQQVSKSITLLYPGLQSNGGHKMPRSGFNGHIYDYVGTGGAFDGRWLTQYQPDPHEVGYNARKTPGGPAGYGRRYELQGFRRTAKLSLPKHPDAVMTVASITGPTRASLKTGDADNGNHDSNVTYEETSAPLAGFRSSDTVERRGRRAFPGNNSWTPELEFLITSTRGTGGTDPERYTPNVYPFTAQGFYREPLLEVPPKEEWSTWNQSA
jgi:hypothetical protein